MSSQTYQIEDLLAQETPLGKLIAQARALEQINHLFMQVLDPELAKHCRVGHYQSGVLTLFAENAGCATKLRYGVPTLLSKLRSIPQWAGLCSIQIKIHQNWHFKHAAAEATPVIKPMSLDPKHALQLLSLAQDLKQKPGMEAIVASLEKLAKHQEK